ncbi:uncharacterized protein LOC114716379 isoform X2 [Neltuma alba]|uniref:uncharacterized protein LOC114716379 isoform X2 n=1 Tax=Neltuma alba TaxID=207710 RepID=UPI0010A3407A|nr:uncharacterized protein LOC114716379 isoform X2 [Prosopis alba]
MRCLISRAIEIEVMAHSLTMAAATTAISRRRESGRGDCESASYCSSLFLIPTSASHEGSPQHHSLSLPRRSLVISGTMLFGLSLSGQSQNARAAARRPPPPPSEEKKDPNVSGVQAKVLASKKRKEAMKQTVAKLREKGNLIKQPPQ